MSSMPHLERHQRDLAEYKKNVSASAGGRFGPLWWGAWDQHVAVPDGGCILDLGVGTGAFLEAAHARHPTASLVGVDLHPEMLALAEATLGGTARLIAGDLAEPLPLDDASVDVAVSSLTFHELPHPPRLLENAQRVVRPGGHLVLFDIVRWPLATYMADRSFDRDSLDHFREHCLFTPDDLAWMVARHDFTVDEVLTRQGGRFAMIFARRDAA